MADRFQPLPAQERKSPHEVQYGVPELFRAPQEPQEATERAKDEADGADH
jgi:hypothetical protein